MSDPCPDCGGRGHFLRARGIMKCDGDSYQEECDMCHGVGRIEQAEKCPACFATEPCPADLCEHPRKVSRFATAPPPAASAVPPGDSAASPEKITRDISTPESREFWESAVRAAAEVADWPAWKRAGINTAQVREGPRPTAAEASPEVIITDLGHGCSELTAASPEGDADRDSWENLDPYGYHGKREIERQLQSATEEIIRLRALLEKAEAALVEHQTMPDPNDPDGWIRRSALNHWVDRAEKAETRAENIWHCHLNKVEALKADNRENVEELQARLDAVRALPARWRLYDPSPISNGHTIAECCAAELMVALAAEPSQGGGT